MSWYSVHYNKFVVFFFNCAPLELQYGLPWAMAQELAQSLAQNLGIQWEPAARKPSMYMDRESLCPP